MTQIRSKTVRKVHCRIVWSRPKINDAVCITSRDSRVKFHLWSNFKLFDFDALLIQLYIILILMTYVFNSSFDKLNLSCQWACHIHFLVNGPGLLDNNDNRIEKI